MECGERTGHSHEGHVTMRFSLYFQISSYDACARPK